MNSEVDPMEKLINILYPMPDDKKITQWKRFQFVLQCLIALINIAHLWLYFEFMNPFDNNYRGIIDWMLIAIMINYLLICGMILVSKKLNSMQSLAIILLKRQIEKNQKPEDSPNDT